MCDTDLPRTVRIWGERRIPPWGAFAYRDFRLIWSGQIVSQLGTWMQFTALGYYVAKLAPNAGLGSFYIGLLGASREMPHRPTILPCQSNSGSFQVRHHPCRPSG